MSSDSSDDDFNYTNTARLLKHMTKKIRTDDGHSSFDSPTASPVKIIPIEDNQVNISESIDNQPIEIVEESNITTRTRRKNPPIQLKIDSINLCLPPKTDNQADRVESDTDLDKSYDIISQIDACLARNNESAGPTTRCVTRSRGRGAGPKRKRTAATRSRSNQASASHVVLGTIEIDPDYPVLNSQAPLPEDVNYDVSVKVVWKSQHLERFSLRRFQKMEPIFTHFAQKENVSEERLFFTLKEKVVTRADTPYTLGITAASIIEGGVLSAKTFLCSAIEYSRESIELKVQIKDAKRPLMIHMNVTDQMDVLISQCAEELQVPAGRLKLYFDGDVIRPTDSPMSLEFEGGECIDCYKVD